MKHGGSADFRLIQETELYIRVNGKSRRAIGMAMRDTLQQDCKNCPVIIFMAPSGRKELVCWTRKTHFASRCEEVVGAAIIQWSVQI